jgi:hypothetical protein
MAQASSLAVWRPLSMPLTLTGSLRALSAEGSGAGAGSNLAAGVVRPTSSTAIRASTPR